MTRRSFVNVAAAASVVRKMQAAQKQTTLGLAPASMTIKRVRDPLAYLDYLAGLGFGGCQIGIRDDTPIETVQAIRKKAESAGLYLEGSARQARDGDKGEFEQRMKLYKELGVTCFRTTCLSGRRYETFGTLGEWLRAETQFKRWLALSVRVCDRLKIKMGVENHKDWTTEEFVKVLNEYESEYLGVCLDMGNNMSLCDDPHETIDTLAPYAVNMHIKDIGVQSCEDGFLQAQVALGTGILDLKRITATLKRQHPKINFTLEMMTRNPLKIPCLTDRYWATMPHRGGRYLARTLNLVKAHGRQLHNLDPMSQQQKEEFEQKNFQTSIAYARDELGLV